jgi:hypothetical protein
MRGSYYYEEKDLHVLATLPPQIEPEEFYMNQISFSEYFTRI